MGSRSRRVSRRTNMKTIFVVAAFLAMALGAPQADTSEAASGPNADAEADPWYGYYGYGYRPYGYGYYGHRYGYYGYYGKRSADAEPTADAAASHEAEADPWYGYYGGHTAMDTMATDLMDMDTTMERGLLMLSPLLMLLPVLRPRLIPGTDTTDTG